MSVSAITLSLSDVNLPATEKNTPVSAQPQSTKRAETDTQVTQDTVELTHFAQIQQLSLQGETASQIAAVTGLPLSEIDSDLNISSAPAAVTATPANTAGATPATPAASSPSTSLPDVTSNTSTAAASAAALSGVPTTANATSGTNP